jgi:hypothetical protein
MEYSADRTERPMRLVTKQQVEEKVVDLPVCSACRKPCQTIKVERPGRRLVSRCCHASLRRKKAS